MPLHRVGDRADALEACVADLERKGEQVVAVLPWGNEFLVVTVAKSRYRTTTRGPRETRGRSRKVDKG